MGRSPKREGEKRRRGDPMNVVNAGLRPVKESGKKEELGRKSSRLQCSSEKVLTSQWDVLRQRKIIH